VILLVLFPLPIDVRFTCLLHLLNTLKSQSLSLPSLKTWIAIEQSGEVLCAHCRCMAGIGEAHSHIAAVLFTVEANTQMKHYFSCMSLPCFW